MRNRLIYFTLMAGFLIVFVSCVPADGDHPGVEYVPDMKHSIAFEANYYNYYWLNTWGGEEEYYKFITPKSPVEGTIPLGQSAMTTSLDGTESNQIVEGLQGYPLSGSVPYYYENTEEDRLRAAEEITDNPFPITEGGLAKGKELYNIYCAICHGEKGDGNGFLVREDGGVYPAQPTSFLLDEWVSTSNGQYYHAIMHGRNVMGPYNDKLSYEERWQVIHHIRSLQAAELELAYNEEENTLTDREVPAPESPQ